MRRLKKARDRSPYRWYPRHPNGEPNLNPWWAVTYRRVNQWVRRVGWPLFRPRRYQELLWEQARIAAPDEIDIATRQRLGELLWILGQDFPWRSTPEQAARANEKMKELIREITAKEYPCWKEGEGKR